MQTDIDLRLLGILSAREGKVATERSCRALASDSPDLARTLVGRLIDVIEIERIAAGTRSKGAIAEPVQASAAFGMLKTSDVAVRRHVVLWLWQHRDIVMRPRNFGSDKPIYGVRGFGCFSELMRSALDVPAETLLDMAQTILAAQGAPVDRPMRAWGERPAIERIGAVHWPLARLLQQVERQSRQAKLSEPALGQLLDIRAAWELGAFRAWPGDPFARLAKRIDEILQEDSGSGLAPYEDLPGDAFGDTVLLHIASMTAERAKVAHMLLHTASKAKGTKPSAAFLKSARNVLDQCDADWIKTCLESWLDFAATSDTVLEKRIIAQLSDTVHYGEFEILFTPANADVLKGLVWIAASVRSDALVTPIANLVARAFETIPGKGPAASGVGSAGLQGLALIPGETATASLVELADSLSQASARKKIAALLQER